MWPNPQFAYTGYLANFELLNMLMIYEIYL